MRLLARRLHTQLEEEVALYEAATQAQSATRKGSMAPKKPNRDQQDQFEELQEQEYEEQSDEAEMAKARRDSGVSRHRSKGRDKRSSAEP